MDAAALLQFIVAAALVIFVIWRDAKKKKKKDYRLPPGPRRWPIVGNLLQVGSVPHKSMMEFTKEYGSLVYLKLGVVPTVVTDCPVIVKEILLKQDHVFASRPENIACQYFTYNGRDIAFAPYGSHWRNMRKLCTLELLSSRKLATFRLGRSEELDCFVDEVWRDAEQGKMINLRDRFASLSCNNLTRMLLGKRYFGAGNAGPEDAAEHKAMIYEGFALVNAFNVADYLPYLRWMDLQGHEKKMRAIMKRTDECYDMILEEHKQKKKKKLQSSSAEEDFVDVLLNVPGEDGEEHLSDTTIKAIIIDMISAGTDTSSVTSEWAMAELIRNPEALKKARDEIDEIVGLQRLVEESDVMKMNYLKAVVKEIFRLHPVGAFLIPHLSTKDATVAGYDIPNNTRILINTYSLGRNSSTWGEDALLFKPERFLHHHTESSQRFSQQTGIFPSNGIFPQKSMESERFVELVDSECRIVPFGGGRRSCPGATLGSCMVLMGIARLIHSFEWYATKEIDYSERIGFTMLANPLELLAKPRLATHLYHLHRHH